MVQIQTNLHLLLKKVPDKNCKLVQILKKNGWNPNLKLHLLFSALPRLLRSPSSSVSSSSRRETNPFTWFALCHCVIGSLGLTLGWSHFADEVIPHVILFHFPISLLHFPIDLIFPCFGIISPKLSIFFPMVLHHYICQSLSHNFLSDGLAPAVIFMLNYF